LGHTWVLLGQSGEYESHAPRAKGSETGRASSHSGDRLRAPTADFLPALGRARGSDAARESSASRSQSSTLKSPVSLQLSHIFKERAPLNALLLGFPANWTPLPGCPWTIFAVFRVHVIRQKRAEIVHGDPSRSENRRKKVCGQQFWKVAFWQIIVHAHFGPLEMCKNT